ncbi:hypothetical protein [Entomobacter blattae]|uniref:Uncharacterized protein n=1 Tax=Entomobacter blattae TaxID=2762277 RepID=A0A7H1NQE8_9PROT|nr:hypothetical protein [Entomobacter blattae]QNT78008.1 hypothetical protein JGUZn3_07750 [Entomobacter blattae]
MPSRFIPSAVLLSCFALSPLLSARAAPANPDFNAIFNHAPSAQEEKYQRLEKQEDIYGNVDTQDDTHLDRAIVLLNARKATATTAFNTANCSGRIEGQLSKMADQITITQPASYVDKPVVHPECRITFKAAGHSLTAVSASEGCRVYTGASCNFVTEIGTLNRVYK